MTTLLRLLVLSLVLASARAAVAAPGPALRRFALVASANDGGPGRVKLRFADSDAQAFAGVLVRLGGVQSGDMVVRHDTTRASLTSAFQQMRTVLARADETGARRELLVYYSGHSDEEGLLLGRERVPYRELRQWIEDTGADVRIAILDSCASGALLRAKGGVHRAPFLADASTQARGHAFLTASSADEAAQESDRIGAAFFTHYLVSGLRGAADANRDQRITLNEAYQFAYAETLKRTETSRVGAQHAAYDIQLAGTGDLVMTDLRSASSRLVLEQRLKGRIYVRDSGGRLIAEIRKEPHYPVELGLDAGSYRVVLDADGRPYETNVALSEGGRVELRTESFSPAEALVATARGGGSDDAAVSLPGDAGARRTYKLVPADFVLVPGARLFARDPEPVMHNFVLGLVTHSDALSGVQIGIGGNIVADHMAGVQTTSGFNLNYGTTRGVQMSGIANIGMGDTKGIQVGGVVNYGGASFRGIQLATVNLTKGPTTGLQVGVVNGGNDRLDGLQLGAVNAVRDMQGIQLAALNVGGRVSGLQLGAINIASEVHGAQIGVINVAGQVHGASLGILPIVRDGRNVVTAWSSDVSLSNLGVKLGAEHVYTLLGVGVTNGTRDDRTALFSYTLALGGHIVPFGGRFFLDIDVGATSYAPTNFENVDEQGHNVLSTLRLMAGYQLARHFAIVGGPTYNVNVSMDGRDFRRGLGFAETVDRSGTTTVRMFPGFTVGVEL